MKHTYLYISALLFTSFLASCSSDENFDNKVFFDSTAKTSEMIIKGSVAEMTKTINVALAKPAEANITFAYKADASMVKTYNAAYYGNAVMLPDTCYSIGDKTVTINAGSVKSKDTEVKFFKLSSLSRDT